MSKYKDTLNLPKTDFPMKANLASREPLILKKWDTLHLYQKIREKNKNAPRFIFHDGPPYANGHIHMGTAINKILKDTVVKSKTLSGFDCAFIPGWDCHGLPIELNVEKKVGKPGKKLNKTEFRKACREYAYSQIEFQREEFKRLGIVADWAHPYLTMDFTFEGDVIRSLAKIIKNGHVQKGVKPIYWCLDCGSALAEAEVEYQDKHSDAIDVRFIMRYEDKLKDLFPDIDRSLPLTVPIWTTTPWTLPANMAVALHPTFEYALVKTDKEYLLIAEALVEKVLQQYSIENYEIVGRVPGSHFENMLLQHPFYERQVPIILADFVTVESGTGAVHSAGAHGPDDFVITQKYGIPLIDLVNDDGVFKPDTPLIAGLHVNKVDKEIINILKDRGNLLHLNKIIHSYPHCWRHKTPVIFRATPQWFISMEKNNLRQMALATIPNITWVPEWGENRIYSMIENRPDWCISRQRTWGVPIPIFTNKTTGEMHPDTIHLMEKVAAKVDKEGIEAWFSTDSQAFLGDEASQYSKSNDVLDVWFDSGVTQECVLKKRAELGFPADLYLEGSDQHRGWFHSSLLTSLAMNGEAPYRTVLTHGYVIDIEGRKMSKSLGNVIAPDTIIKSLGADILRLWAASVDYRGDIFISDEILTRISDTYRRLRNTARFLLANLAGFTPSTDLVPDEQLIALDRYIIDKTKTLQEDIVKAYDTYQFHLIYQKVHQFCSVDLGSFYLDIIKDRQYTTHTESIARKSTQTAMYHIIEALVRLFAPILTFTAEEIWPSIPGERNESVFLNQWYQGFPVISENTHMDKEFWDKIRQIRDKVNIAIEAKRNAGELGSSLEAAVDIYCNAETKKILDLLEDELRFVLITSTVTVHVWDKETLECKVISLRDEQKCERCWHRTQDIGQNAEHPTLCLRCVENVSGKGEIRKYA